MADLPDRIIVTWTKGGRATVSTPASAGMVRAAQGEYVRPLPAPPLADDVADFLKWVKAEKESVLGLAGEGYSEEPVTVYTKAADLIERLARELAEERALAVYQTARRTNHE